MPPNAAVAAALNAHLSSNGDSNASAYARLEQLNNSSQYNAIYQHYLASLIAANNNSLNNQLKLNSTPSNLTPTTSLNNNNASLNTNCSTTSAVGQLTNHNNETLDQSIAKLESMENKNQAPLYFV